MASTNRIGALSWFTGRCAWCWLSVGWIALLAAGFYVLIDYDLQPGTAGEPPVTCPADAGLPHDGHQWSLVMFLHPNCPCSRASLTELMRLVEQARVPLALRIWFFSPADEPKEWTQTALWRQAARIPGAELQIDTGGQEAKRMGAATSGQTLLYAPDGRLVFSGGITAIRGHDGANPASDRLSELLTDPSIAGQTSTQVFGCPLSDVQPSGAVQPSRIGAK